MKLNLARCFALALIGLLVSAGGKVEALTIGDLNELGFVDKGIPAGSGDVTAYVNQLIGMAPGTTANALGQGFTRSSNSFNPLDKAVLASRATYGGISAPTVTILLGAGFEYLLAKYDGPNFGTEVWYVGGLTGEITIPSHAGGENNTQYGLSATSLFTPVPDAASTALLLACALSGLGLFCGRMKCT